MKANNSRWPVIIAIIVAIVFAIFTVYCCLRCCGCCGLGRRGSRRRANTQPSGFNPLAYQGYAPAGAPAPGYGAPEPPRFAQFDNTSNRKITEDSLPAMPTWSQGQDRKVPTAVEDEGNHGDLGLGRDVEMGHIEKRGLMNNASTIDLAPPAAHQRQNSYTGPDFDAVDTSYGGAAHHDPYTGPDFGKPAPQYSPYQPLPTHGRTATQDMGTTYGNTQPPSSPTLQSGFAAAPPPNALQAGRRPEGSYRDI